MDSTDSEVFQCRTHHEHAGLMRTRRKRAVMVGECDNAGNVKRWIVLMTITRQCVEWLEAFENSSVMLRRKCGHNQASCWESRNTSVL